MALGDVYNNNKKKDYSPTVYSPYSFSNPESTVDPTKLSFTYWNNMLKLSVSPRKQTNDDQVAFDYDNSISVYLTHTKARLLAEEIELFMQDPTAYSNMGVPSGAGLVSISNGKEVGVNCPCLIIRKIDEQGIVTASIAYQFKQQYHYSIRNYSEKKSDGFDKIFNDDIEILELQQVLVGYYQAMTAATAYSVMEQQKYDMSRINTKLELIGDKLGIEFGKNNKGGGKSSSSFFNSSNGNNNGGGAQFSNSSLEDIDELMK